MRISSNRRIFLNIVATYGRSVYAIVVGLFASRWVLMSLGEVDYGLVGLVGGLIALVSFFNNLLSSSVMRFYAVSVGKVGKLGQQNGVEECRKWFSTAVFIHTVVPIVLVIIGYPVGEWAVRNFLTIPTDRVDACVWVWRFTCLSCFACMVNVPFQAMYTAKQEIAELTLYGFATTTCNAIFYYYMVTHAGFWLVKYSMWTCIMGIVPQLLIGVNGFIRFKECRLRLHYMWDLKRFKDLVSYAGAKLWNNLGTVVSSQGQAILVNKFLGPRFNASMSVAHTVSATSSNLSLSMGAAYWPAIANAAGADDLERVKVLTFQVCRLGTVFLLLFVIPLSLEINEVMRLWLKNPPVFSAEICLALIITLVLGNLCDGYWMAIMGTGKGVWMYNFIVGWASFVQIGLAFVLFTLGFRMWGLWCAIVIGSCCTVVFRLALGRKYMGYSIRYWFRTVLLPIALLAVFSLLSGLPVRFAMRASLLRVMFTSICSVSVMIVCAWFLVLSSAEKEYLTNKINMLRIRFKL